MILGRKQLSNSVSMWQFNVFRHTPTLPSFSPNQSDEKADEKADDVQSTFAEVFTRTSEEPLPSLSQSNTNTLSINPNEQLNVQVFYYM
jgi:hypothetical protein